MMNRAAITEMMTYIKNYLMLYVYIYCGYIADLAC